MERTEITRFPYWHEKLTQAGLKKTIPMPKTMYVEVDREILAPLCDGEIPIEVEKLLPQWKSIANRIGYPLFLRTDLVSGKHDWKRTCFVEDETVLLDHIQGVVEANEMVDLVGAPYKYLVFREFIPFHWRFHAFHGEMPVARERRYFVKDGKVVCHHPYWIPASILRPSIENWEEALEDINYESLVELTILTDYAERIGKVLGGYWSIDFAWTDKQRLLDSSLPVDDEHGTWYFIDAADALLSYHWEGCPLDPTISKEDEQE
jgi:hypothetical protein